MAIFSNFRKKNNIEKTASENEKIMATQTEKTGFFSSLKNSLKRTRENFNSNIVNLFTSKKIDVALLEELEALLLTADVGVTVTKQIIDELTKKLSRNELSSTEILQNELKLQLQNILLPCEKPLQIAEHIKPFVILLVGVNGSGKTTTIGKLANKLQAQGKKIMLAAGDTFRAAAIEQLKVWGERNNVPVIAQHTGADSAAVVFDALQSAKARNVDVLIADTAGRLHTQSNLMDELKKVKRILQKIDATAPHEILLVLDATVGQNALNQAKEFSEAIGVTGICITKLDGTAKGGIIFAIAQQLKLPIRFIGVGENIDDLKPFVAQEFVEALFSN